MLSCHVVNCLLLLLSRVAVWLVLVWRPILLGGKVRSLLSLSSFAVSFLFLHQSLTAILSLSLSLELPCFFLLAIVFDCCFGVAGPSCRVSGSGFQGGGSGSGFQDLAKGASRRLLFPPCYTCHPHCLSLILCTLFCFEYLFHCCIFGFGSFLPHHSSVSTILLKGADWRIHNGKLL